MGPLPPRHPRHWQSQTEAQNEKEAAEKMSRVARTAIALVAGLLTAGILTFALVMLLKGFGLWHISIARIGVAVAAIFVGIGVHMATSDRLANRAKEPK